MGSAELHSEDESNQDTRATLPYIETIPCPPDSSGHSDPAVAVLVETARPPADLDDWIDEPRCVFETEPAPPKGTIPYRLTELADAYFSKRGHALLTALDSAIDEDGDA